MVDVVLQRPHNDIAVCAEHIGQQQLVAIPVGIDRLVERNLRLLVGDFADVHQNLVFDAARRIRRKLDVPVGPEGIDGLDQTNGSDGDQVLQIDTGVFEPARDIHDKAKIMLDEQLLGCLVALFQRGDGLPLLLRLQRCGQHVAAADVHDLPRLQKAELL